jgi:hypothetical protein
MATVRMSLALAAILLLSLAAPALAGTEADPEITDPSDDAGDAPQAEQDIVKVWVDDALTATEADGSPALFFHVETAGDSQQAPAFFALSERYRVSFVPSTGVPGGGVEAYVNISPTRANGPGGAPAAGAESVSCKFGTATEAGGSAPLASEGAAEGVQESASVLGCRLPLALLPGFGAGSSIAGLVATLQLVQRGPLSGTPPAGGDQAGVNVLETYDTAPDSGAGRLFVLAGGAGLLRGTLNGTSAVIHHAFNATQGATYLYNWTTNATALSLSVDVHATNGTANVTVTDGAGKVAFNQSLSGTLTQTVPLNQTTAGNWTIAIRYTAFAGRLNLTIAPTVAPPPTTTSTSTTASSSTTGHTTTTSATATSTTKKGTPSLGVAFLLAGLGLAVCLRRRD